MSSQADPCLFPVLARSSHHDHPHGHSEVPVDISKLDLRLHRLGVVKLLPLVKAAWSLTLHSFCEVDHVSFGFCVIMPDGSISADGEQCLRVSITPHTKLQDLVDEVCVQSLPMSSPSNELYNTRLSVRVVTSCEGLDIMVPTQCPKERGKKDGPHYAVEVRLTIDQSNVKIGLQYDGRILSKKQARDVASTVEHAIVSLRRVPQQTAGITPTGRIRRS
jgi:hypothetical protein